ncbi:MAG: PilZ domain-containing protein [Brevinematales bacterium]|nr:PilZ domain-containing protein [Brevinematales bacterium]
MNILIYTQSKFILEHFVDTFFPAGISVFHCDSTLMIDRNIITHQIDILYIDLTGENIREATDILRIVRAHSDPVVLGVIVTLYIENVPKEGVNRVLHFGADGVVQSNFTAEQLIHYSLMVYERTHKEPPSLKLRNVRLNPSLPPEYIVIKLVSPLDEQSILGVLIDLSLGGMAIKLVGTYSKTAIEKGMHFNNIEFILLGHEMRVDGIVAAFAKDVCAVIFTQMTQADRHEICQFIFMKLSNLI